MAQEQNFSELTIKCTYFRSNYHCCGIGGRRRSGDSEECRQLAIVDDSENPERERPPRRLSPQSHCMCRSLGRSVRSSLALCCAIHPNEEPAGLLCLKMETYFGATAADHKILSPHTLCLPEKDKRNFVNIESHIWFQVQFSSGS